MVTLGGYPDSNPKPRGAPNHQLTMVESSFKIATCFIPSKVWIFVPPLPTEMTCVSL